MIKRVLATLAGAIVGVFTVHFATLIIGELFGPLYNSEEDMQRNVVIYLFCMAFAAILGGWLGNQLAAKFKRRKQGIGKR